MKYFMPMNVNKWSKSLNWITNYITIDRPHTSGLDYTVHICVLFKNHFLIKFFWSTQTVVILRFFTTYVRINLKIWTVQSKSWDLSVRVLEPVYILYFLNSFIVFPPKFFEILVNFLTIYKLPDLLFKFLTFSKRVNTMSSQWYRLTQHIIHST